MFLAELEEIEKYAKENRVPIMEPDGIQFLTNYIREHHIKNILEIGSAIGYSAIKMALVDEDIHVTTVERDEMRYHEALKNIKKFHLDDRITIYFDDAFNLELEDSYDLIFIDAAKAQYTKFFLKFKDYLCDHGVIVSDNINFHGLTHSREPIQSKNVRGLVKKINAYITFLKTNSEFETVFYEVGDGVAVSKRK